MISHMTYTQGVTSKLLMASRHTTRCLRFLAAVYKQTSGKNYSMNSKFHCRHLQVTASLVQCRLKSDSTVNATDHLVELGMPQTADDLQRLAENFTARNMDVNVSDLVRLFV